MLYEYTSLNSLNNIYVYHYSYSLNHSPLDIKPWYWLPKLHQTRICDVISKGSCMFVNITHTHSTILFIFSIYHFQKEMKRRKELWVYIVKGVYKVNGDIYCKMIPQLFLMFNYGSRNRNL